MNLLGYLIEGSIRVQLGTGAALSVKLQYIAVVELSLGQALSCVIFSLDERLARNVVNSFDFWWCVDQVISSSTLWVYPPVDNAFFKNLPVSLQVDNEINFPAFLPEDLIKQLRLFKRLWKAVKDHTVRALRLT